MVLQLTSTPSQPVYPTDPIGVRGQSATPQQT